jgi:GDPmannose 4,6-dehydratase
MKALIIGVSGQDGSFLSKYLLRKNYSIVGTSRDAKNADFNNLKKLNIFNNIEKISLNTQNLKDIERVIKLHKPNEIYNLSGQTSVGASFINRVETYNSIFISTLNILEAIKNTNRDIKFFNAGSGEIYGGNEVSISDESSIIAPMSPYGVAKASSQLLVDSYRKSFKIFCCTGITFNHESPLRPEHFVTKKIVKSAYSISKGLGDKLYLGNIEIERDWGYAPEYVVAMNLILNHKVPNNYVIATGKITSLKNFIKLAFSFFDLNYENYIEIDKELTRKTDINISGGNPKKIYEDIGWKSELSIEDIVIKMCEDLVT